MSAKTRIRFPFAKLYVRLAKLISGLALLAPAAWLGLEYMKTDGGVVQTLREEPASLVQDLLLWFGGGLGAAFLILVMADFLSCYLQIEDNTAASVGLLKKLVVQLQPEDPKA